MNLVTYPDREMMMIDLANQLAGELNSCLVNHDWASFAVPGGTTPGPIFDVLSAADLDWERVHVMLTDERWVPAGSERSNTRLVKERLFTGRAAAAQFVPFYRGGAAPEDDLDAIAADLASELPISVLLLGMGPDMHVASLFPGGDRLTEALDHHAQPIMAMRAEGAGEPRVTLTAPVLDGAMSKHIVITGSDKRDALENAGNLSREEAPVKAVWSGATVHWAE